MRQITFWVVIALALTACGKSNSSESAAGTQAGLQGPAGAQGPAGPQGATGPAGAPGISIASVTFCSHVSTFESISSFFEYEIVTYSTGDKFVNCAISGSASQSSDTATYKAAENGAASSACVLTYSPGDNNAGYWVFTSQGSTTQTVYNDTSSASNGTTVTFAASDCTTN